MPRQERPRRALAAGESRADAASPPKEAGPEGAGAGRVRQALPVGERTREAEQTPGG
ncbi:MAG: hypothetical protein LBQ79_05425 [Deltaproteobacteria bacterium]|nr:hypothetical protein [Deltaproteobacteria bacterium]